MTMAVAHHPQAVAYARAGLLAIRAGAYHESARLLQRAVELDPMLGEAWRWLGALHQGAKRAMCLSWARRSIPHATIPVLPQVADLPAVPVAPVASAPAAVLTSAPAAASGSGVRPVALALMGALAASLIALGGFELAYAERVYPGISAYGVALGGSTQQEVAATLAPVLDAWGQQQLTVRVGAKAWQAPYSFLAPLSADAAAHYAYAQGRAGGWGERLQIQGAALLADGQVALPLRQEAVANLLERIAAAVDSPPVAASFVRNADGAWAISPAEAGRILDRDAAAALLSEHWAAIDWSGDPFSTALELPLLTIAPERTAEDLAPHLERLAAQTAAPLELTFEDQRWTFERADLLDLARLPSEELGFGVDRTALDALLDTLVATVERAPEPSFLVREGNRAREWRLGQAGRTLDRQVATERLIAAVRGGVAEPVPLPVIITAPPPGELEALGITDVLGVGDSQFLTYSDANRDANVVVGGSEFDGLIIAPGEVVSFNATVGSITYDKGYRMGEMISGGVSVPSLGGGICQVSTTLYRALFWSGLEIVERHNHAWRLPWYEVDAPVGMDATIVLGGPDLKFRNTTASHLLIDVETNLDAKTQRFTIYGPRQEREIALVGPTWQGGAVVITRQIFANGGLVAEDQWSSYYSQ